MYPSSELNLPGSINSKNGFSFGYREETKLIERSPGAIYDVKNDTIASVTNDGYFIQDAENNFAEISAMVHDWLTAKAAMSQGQGRIHLKATAMGVAIIIVLVGAKGAMNKS